MDSWQVRGGRSFRRSESWLPAAGTELLDGVTSPLASGTDLHDNEPELRKLDRQPLSADTGLLQAGTELLKGGTGLLRAGPELLRAGTELLCLDPEQETDARFLARANHRQVNALKLLAVAGQKRRSARQKTRVLVQKTRFAREILRIGRPEAAVRAADATFRSTEAAITALEDVSLP